MSALFDRRGILAGVFALAACGRHPDGSHANLNPRVPPLKSLTPVPVGCAVTLAELGDPAFQDVLLRNFSQITPTFEMKMNIVMRSDGSLHPDAADQLVAFARGKGLRVHGTSLVWYKHEPQAFKALDWQRDAFRSLYVRWIEGMVGRYRGQIAGWDVVNEPLTHEGDGLRHSLWSQNLGAEGHIVQAFQLAARADPNAVMFLNEYDLENRPAKRKRFLQLVESLLKQGAPIGGLGTQTHLELDRAKGELACTLRDLASFGLPVHVSELDISFSRWKRNPLPREELLRLQADRAMEVAEAFAALPAKQRYALTLWGLRDADSWLQLPPFDPARGDMPLAFYDNGTPKPMLRALADGLAKASR